MKKSLSCLHVLGFLLCGASLSSGNPTVAIQDADRRIGAYEKILEKGSPRARRHTAWNILENPAGPRRLNRVGSPNMIGNASRDVRAVHRESKQIMKMLLQDELIPLIQKQGGRFLYVDIWEVTNPGGGLKLGQDWDITPKLRYVKDGVVQFIDLLHLEGQGLISPEKLKAIANKSVHLAVHRDPSTPFRVEAFRNVKVNAETAAKTAARGQVEVGHRQASDAFGKNAKEAKNYLGKHKGVTLPDPDQIAHTLKYKSHLPLTEAETLLAKAEDAARKLEKAGRFRDAFKIREQARALAAGKKLEALEQALKAYNKQLVPKLIAQGYKPPRRIAEGMKMVNEFLKNQTGSIDDLNQLLRSKGFRNWKVLVDQQSHMVSDIMKWEQIKQRNLKFIPPEPGMAANVLKGVGVGLTAEFLLTQHVRGYNKTVEERARWDLNSKWFDPGLQLESGVEALYQTVMIPAHLLEGSSMVVGAGISAVAERVSEIQSKKMEEGQSKASAFGSALSTVAGTAMLKLDAIYKYYKENPGEAASKAGYGISAVAGMLLQADAVANFIELDREVIRREYRTLRRSLETARNTVRDLPPELAKLDEQIRRFVDTLDNTPQNIERIEKLEQQYRMMCTRFLQACMSTRTRAQRYPFDPEAQETYVMCSKVLQRIGKTLPLSHADLIAQFKSLCTLEVALVEQESGDPILQHPAWIRVSGPGVERVVKDRGKTSYLVTRIPPGKHLVDVSANQYVPKKKQIAFGVNGKTQLRIRVRLERKKEAGPYYATLTMYAKDALTDAYIRNVTFTLESPEGRAELSSPTGGVKFDRVASGRSKIVARAAGYAPKTMIMDIDPEKQREHIGTVFMVKNQEKKPGKETWDPTGGYPPDEPRTRTEKPPDPASMSNAEICKELTRLWIEHERRESPKNKFRFVKPFHWDSKKGNFIAVIHIDAPKKKGGGYYSLGDWPFQVTRKSALNMIRLNDWG